MGFTEREAANLHATRAVQDANASLIQAIQLNSREGISWGELLEHPLRLLSIRLISIFVRIDGAAERPLRDELVSQISQMLTSFVGVFSLTRRGKESEQVTINDLQTRYANAVAGDFDLAAWERNRGRLVGKPSAPTRRKNEKHGILDSYSHYVDDFPLSVGVLGVAVVFVDVDDFKKVNTRFTEPVVDRSLLPELQRLIDSLVARRGFVYAEGGDEIVITLPNTDAALAEAFTGVLLEKVRGTLFIVNGESVTVTLSAGIAASTSINDAEACRDAAALAKQHAKLAGKDRYVVAPAEATSAGCL